MPNFSFRNRSSRWLSAAALASVSSLSAFGQYDPDWARNFRVGLLTGFNIKADFRMTGDFGVSGSRIGQIGVSGQSHRFDDDNYVLVDSTGNAGGYTTRWGYDGTIGRQVGNQMRFDSTDSFSVNNAQASGEDQSPYLGFDLAYGGVLWRGERMRVGWEFGFGLLPISLKDSSALSANVRTRTLGFDIPEGVIIPGAPYQGSGSGHDQPLLSDVAEFIDEQNVIQTVTGTRELDVMLYAFKLGPSVFWDLHPSFALALSAGPAVGFVTGEYRFDELIDSEVQNRGSFSKSELVFGGYVNATFTYHATLNGDFYLSAQYMPLGTADFSQGGRVAELDLSGAIYLSAGINWPF